MMSRRRFIVQVFFAISFVHVWSHASAVTPKIHSIDMNVTSRTGIPKEFATWSLVGKCCPVGRVILENDPEEEDENATGPTSCVVPSSSIKIDYAPLFSDYNSTGLFAPGLQRAEFVAIIGDPCPFGKYRLEPDSSEDDKYYLMKNGSVFTPNVHPSMLAPGKDYCIEYVPGLGTSTFVCFSPELEIVAADARLTFYALGLLVSVLFLVATVLAYIFTRPLCDAHGRTVACYSGCLAIAFVTLAILHLASTSLSDEVCVSIAFVIQFSFVSCFFWLNAMAIETWQLVRRYAVESPAPTNIRVYSNRLFFFYSLWGWGVPALLVILSIILRLSPTIPTTYVKPSMQDTSCWFRFDKAALPYFYTPVGILAASNVILYTMTGFKLRRAQKDLDLRRLARNEVSHHEDLRRYRNLKITFIVCLVLFIIMGVNSLMELISMWAGSDSLAWSAFDFVNALQGVLVFGLFVFREPARTLAWRRLKKLIGGREADYDQEVNGVTLLPGTNDNLSMERSIQ